MSIYCSKDESINFEDTIKKSKLIGSKNLIISGLKDKIFDVPKCILEGILNKFFHNIPQGSISALYICVTVTVNKL